MLCSVVSLANDGHSEGPMRHNLKIGQNFNKFPRNISILPIRESDINHYHYYQVTKTLLHVLVTFFVLIMAFSFSFYILLDNTDAFKYPGR